MGIPLLYLSIVLAILTTLPGLVDPPGHYMTLSVSDKQFKYVTGEPYNIYNIKTVRLYIFTYLYINVRIFIYIWNRGIWAVWLLLKLYNMMTKFMYYNTSSIWLGWQMCIYNTIYTYSDTSLLEKQLRLLNVMRPVECVKATKSLFHKITRLKR